jgi:hypothetical protein
MGRLLPDGRLLAVDSARRRLFGCERNGTMVAHADVGPSQIRPSHMALGSQRGLWPA